MSLPYPLPAGWKVQETQLRRRWPVVLWAAVAAALAVGMVGANLDGAVFAAALYAGFFAAVLAGLGVSYQRAGTERGLPLLLNAVVLGRARTRPEDSWIHFFRETGASRWLTACFALGGLLGSASLLWSAVLALQGGAARLWTLVVVVPLLLFTLVLALAGVIAIVQVVRHATFGHRHLGISIGRHGVVRYYLDEVDVWPWEAIERVEARGTTTDAQTEDFTATLALIAPQRPADVAVDEYDLGAYESHAWLIYTAVRFWAEHPELRTELGTTFAQRRIAQWRDAMAATAREA